MGERKPELNRYIFFNRTETKTQIINKTDRSPV